VTSVDIYTDGACSGNPGPGGWAAILRVGEHEKELSGFVPHTTNNRMELYAALMGLRELTRSCRVTLHSDSAYFISAFEKGWLTNWRKNGWKNSSGADVSNRDLWEQLLDEVAKHSVRFVKVKGHSDHIWNNRCDKMAVNEIRKNTVSIDV
jgi:ribonuclease HI